MCDDIYDVLYCSMNNQIIKDEHGQRLHSWSWNIARQVVDSGVSRCKYVVRWALGAGQIWPLSCSLLRCSFFLPSGTKSVAVAPIHCLIGGIYTTQHLTAQDDHTT